MNIARSSLRVTVISLSMRRFVAGGVGKNDWVPAGVIPGVPLPLCLDELADLYRTARAVSARDELEATLWFPDPATLPSPDEFAAIINEQASLAGADLITGSQFWDTKPRVADIVRLEALCNRIQPALAKIDDREPWKLTVIDAGRLGASNREPWEELIKLIERHRGHNYRYRWSRRPARSGAFTNSAAPAAKGDRSGYRQASPSGADARAPDTTLSSSLENLDCERESQRPTSDNWRAF